MSAAERAQPFLTEVSRARYSGENTSSPLLFCSSETIFFRRPFLGLHQAGEFGEFVFVAAFAEFAAVQYGMDAPECRARVGKLLPERLPFFGRRRFGLRQIGLRPSENEVGA